MDLVDEVDLIAFHLLGDVHRVHNVHGVHSKHRKNQIDCRFQVHGVRPGLFVLNGRRGMLYRAAVPQELLDFGVTALACFPQRSGPIFRAGVDVRAAAQESLDNLDDYGERLPRTCGQVERSLAVMIRGIHVEGLAD
jgi:hypothetical protein